MNWSGGWVGENSVGKPLCGAVQLFKQGFGSYGSSQMLILCPKNKIWKIMIYTCLTIFSVA